MAKMPSTGCSDPVLPGSDLVLTRLAAHDLADWLACLSDPRVTRHTSWGTPGPGTLATLLAACEAPGPDAPLRFAIRRAQRGDFIGTIGFHTVSDTHRTAEIAYELIPEAWGQGFATRLCDAVTDWGLQVRKFVRIQACVLDSNPASARVLEKCGYRQEGVLHQLRMVRGTPRDYRLYARTADLSGSR